MKKILLFLLVSFIFIGCEDKQEDAIVHYFGFDEFIVGIPKNDIEKATEYKKYTISHKDFLNSFIQTLSKQKLSYCDGDTRVKVVFSHSEYYFIDLNGIVISNDMKYGKINKDKFEKSLDKVE